MKRFLILVTVIFTVSSTFAEDAMYKRSLEELGLVGENSLEKSIALQDEFYNTSSTDIPLISPSYEPDNLWEFRLDKGYTTTSFYFRNVDYRVQLITNPDGDNVYIEFLLKKPQALDFEPFENAEIETFITKKGSRVSSIVYIRKDFAKKIKE